MGGREGDVWREGRPEGRRVLRGAARPPARPPHLVGAGHAGHVPRRSVPPRPEEVEGLVGRSQRGGLEPCGVMGRRCASDGDRGSSKGGPFESADPGQLERQQPQLQLCARSARIDAGISRCELSASQSAHVGGSQLQRRRRWPCWRVAVVVGRSTPFSVRPSSDAPMSTSPCLRARPRRPSLPPELTAGPTYPSRRLGPSPCARSSSSLGRGCSGRRSTLGRVGPPCLQRARPPAAHPAPSPGPLAHRLLVSLPSSSWLASPREPGRLRRSPSGRRRVS